MKRWASLDQAVGVSAIRKEVAHMIGSFGSWSCENAVAVASELASSCVAAWFVLPILAVLSFRSGPDAQRCRFGRRDDRWTAAYVRIAAMSGPSPMIFMTRVRL